MADVPFNPPPGFQEDDELWFGVGSARRRRSPHRRPQAWMRPVVPFDTLPRTQRRDMAASMSWRIQSDPNGQGVFTSHDVLPGSREWPLECGGVVHWADLYFMSSRPLRHGVFYNATVTTAAMVASRTIVDRVRSLVMSQIPDEEQELTRVRTFSRPLKKGGREMVFAPHTGIPSLGGLTVDGACARALRDSWEQWPLWVEVCESARFLPGYAHGFGLDLVVRESNLSVDALAQCVDRFRSRGEVEFHDDPFPVENFASAIEPLLEVQLWRWEASQARSNGDPIPSLPSQAAMRVMNHESNAIRL